MGWGVIAQPVVLLSDINNTQYEHVAYTRSPSTRLVHEEQLPHKTTGLCSNRNMQRYKWQAAGRKWKYTVGAMQVL